MQAFGQLKPHIGLNIPNLSAPPLGRDFDTKNGMTIGASYMMGDQFYIEPGLQYSTFGYKFYKTLDENDFSTIDARSINIPLMVGGRFLNKDESFNLRAFTGPRMTWAFAEDLETTDLNLDDRNSILWGWNVGYGIDYKMFFLEVCYEFGLSNYFETHDYDSRNAKQNMLSVRLGTNLFR